MAWWGTRQRPSPRMVVEIAAMKKLFNPKQPVLVSPRVSWDRDFYVETFERELQTGVFEPYWRISFLMRETGPSRIRSGEVYTIKITYKQGFPAKEPWVTILSHDVSDSPHHYGTRHQGRVIICLHGHSGNPREEWDPGRSTAATLGLWAVQWIRAYILWNKTGDWPAEAG